MKHQIPGPCGHKALMPLCWYCGPIFRQYAGRRPVSNVDAWALSSSLASDLLGDVEIGAAFGVHATAAPDQHAALPSYGWSPARMAWVPRWQHVGPQGSVRRVRMADRFVTAEVEFVDPRAAHTPTAADECRGYVPHDVRGTGATCSWSADDEQAHAREALTARRQYVAWWKQALGIVPAHRGRKARPIGAASAPVLADAVSVRAACDAACAACGTWRLSNGLTLTRDGQTLTLALDGVPLTDAHGVPAVRPDVPPTPRGLRAWVDRRVANWHAERAAVLVTAPAPDALGAAMTDVG